LTQLVRRRQSVLTDAAASEIPRAVIARRKDQDIWEEMSWRIERLWSKFHQPK
jgi:hypothetical protein